MSGFVALTNEPAKPPAGMVWSVEAAAMLGLSDSSLRVMRGRPKGEDRGPEPWFKVGSWRIAYRLSDVIAYLKSRAASFDLKAAELRARADAAVRTIEPEERPGFMPRQSPAAGFVSTDSVSNPAEAGASALRARNVQPREVDPDAKESDR